MRTLVSPNELSLSERERDPSFSHTKLAHTAACTHWQTQAQTHILKEIPKYTGKIPYTHPVAMILNKWCVELLKIVTEEIMVWIVQQWEDGNIGPILWASWWEKLYNHYIVFNLKNLFIVGGYVALLFCIYRILRYEIGLRSWLPCHITLSVKMNSSSC